jgi:cell division protein ZapA
MAQVVVTINGRSYPVACGDGEEARTRQLAQYVDRKVVGFAQQLGQIGDARLLVLAALVIADELGDSTEALRQQTQRAERAAGATSEGEGALAAGIDNLAQRIEAIAARLEATHIER